MRGHFSVKRHAKHLGSNKTHLVYQPPFFAFCAKHKGKKKRKGLRACFEGPQPKKDLDETPQKQVRVNVQKKSLVCGIRKRRKRQRSAFEKKAMLPKTGQLNGQAGSFAFSKG